jgi:hypothetical protein
MLGMLQVRLMIRNLHLPKQKMEKTAAFTLLQERK